jgi:retinol dehydrogenase-12
MTQKVALITGATNGIGAVAARELAAQNYHVTIVGRSAERCQNTVASIQKETGNKHIDAIIGDLSLQAEVERVAREAHQRLPRLDVLINNAGAIFLDRRETADGRELTFALNHMAYFILTIHLLDLLKKSAPARIINVSSRAHRGGKLNFDDLQMSKRFWGSTQYANSKLANILFTTELARRLEGSSVTANSLHPGMVATNFGTGNGWKTWAISGLFKLFGISAEKGARTIVYLATSPAVENQTGGYYYLEKPAKVSDAAADPTSAKRLWEISAQLSGLSE